MKRDQLEGLQALMEKDLLTHLEKQTKNSGLPQQDALAFAEQWAYEVDVALRPPRNKTSG